MPEPQLSLTAAASRAQVAACALAAGRAMDRWSLALAAVALLGLVLAAMPLPAEVCLLASLLAAGMQQILALRVAFDKHVFQNWAERWPGAAVRGAESFAYMEDLAAFDQALVACGLCAPSDGVVRDLDSRVKGALGLLKKQALSLVLQVAALTSAVALISLVPIG